MAYTFRPNSRLEWTSGKSFMALILDGGGDWRSARLMSLYAGELLDILRCFDRQRKKLAGLGLRLAVSMLWDETNAQKDGTITRDVRFGPLAETILSGAHIGTANPLFNCSNRNCGGNNDRRPESWRRGTAPFSRSS